MVLGRPMNPSKSLEHETLKVNIFCLYEVEDEIWSALEGCRNLTKYNTIILLPYFLWLNYVNLNLYRTDTVLS